MELHESLNLSWIRWEGQALENIPHDCVPGQLGQGLTKLACPPANSGNADALCHTLACLILILLYHTSLHLLLPFTQCHSMHIHHSV